MTTTHANSTNIVIINSDPISGEAISQAIQMLCQVSANAISILTTTDEVDEWLASGNANPDSRKPKLVVIGGDFTFIKNFSKARAGLVQSILDGHPNLPIVAFIDDGDEFGHELAPNPNIQFFDTSEIKQALSAMGKVLKKK